MAAGASRKISAASARAHTRKSKQTSSFKFPSGMLKKLSVVLLMGFLAWAYQAIKPPPPKICGSTNGPPVTATRIKLSDGRYLAYKESGVPKDNAKYKIVFIHGMDSCRHDIMPVSQEVMEELGVYFLSFDRAGYGEKTSEDLPEGRGVMELFHLLVFVSVLWISILALRLFAKSWFSPKIKLPPGPTGLPLLGSLLRLGNKPNESLAELAKTHGPLMTLRLGFVTTVVVSSAKMAKEVLHKNDQTFTGRTVVDALTALDHNKSSMVWLDGGDLWRNLRKISKTEIFTQQRLDTLEGFRLEKVKQMVERVRNSCGSGVTVDIGSCTFVTSMNLLTNTFFSVDLVDPKLGSAQEFKDLVCGIMEEAGKPNLADYFPVLRSTDPQGARSRMTVYFGELHKFFDKMIDQRLHSRESNSSTTKDLLEVLLDQGQENELEFSRHVIKCLLVDLFTAGTDTSSITVEWAMAELLYNPNAMKKAQSELAETIGKENPVKESDIHRLPYLQAVVKEVMRLHPPFPLLLPHKPKTSIVIDGFTIPKDTQVLINAWAISRDPASWENPTLFFPERFLGSDIDFKGRNFEFIPFGAGRRICPGLPLAQRMIHLMLASLLHAFDWKLLDELPLDMNDKFGLTLQKAVPLCAVPFPRAEM